MKSSEFLNEETPAPAAPMAQPAATAGQQFVGTGTSRDWQMSVDMAARNARIKAAQSIAGTNNIPNGVQLPAGTKYGPQDTKSDGTGKYVSTYVITLPAPSQSAEPAPAAPNAALDSSPATSAMKGSMSTGAPTAVGTAAGNYMKVNELRRILQLSGMELIAEDSSKSVTVQRGDTLSKIAADNSTTVAAIAKLNNIANPDRIYPGDVIKLPGDVIKLPGGQAKRQGSTQIPDRAEKLTTTTSTGNPKIAMEFFLDQGWTPEQAAGLVANLQAESYDQIDPAAQNGGAYGIAQWRGSRKRDFEEEMGRPLKGSSLMDQLKFVQHELNNKESKAGQLLKQATTAAQAAAVVDEFYERSGGAAIRRRIALAKSLLTAFA